jgi:hypothetical protein
MSKQDLHCRLSIKSNSKELVQDKNCPGFVGAVFLTKDLHWCQLNPATIIALLLSFFGVNHVKTTKVE